MNENQVDCTSFRAINSLPVRDTALALLDLDRVTAYIELMCSSL